MPADREHPAAAPETARPGAYLASVALSLAAVTAWLLGGALRHGGEGVFRLINHHLERSDQLLHAWTLDWLYYRLPRDPFGLFQANTFWPHPASLALSDHLVGVAATLLPLRAVIADPLRLVTLGALLTFPLAGTAVAWLVLRLTGSMLAGWVAGLLYAFNPFRLQNLAQIQLLTDYAIPLAFLAFHRYRQEGRPRQLVTLATLVAWQTLCSAYLGAYLAVALGVLLVWTWWREPRLRPHPGAVLVAVTVSGAMVAPFLFPYLRLRALGQLHQHELNSIALSLGLSDLVCWSDCTSFFGLALVPGALVLAVIALWPRAWPGAGTYVAVALIGVSMALGPYLHVSSISDLDAAPDFLAPGPYWALQRWAPAFDGLRAPARAIALTHFALTVLAGMGTARLLALLPATGLRRLATAAIAAAALATTSRPTVTFEPLPALRPTEVHRWLAEQPSRDPIVEIPVSLYDDLVMYQSRIHRRPIVNGYSGFLPFGHRYAVATLRCYPCPEALATLADLGVHTHIVHLGLLPAARRTQMEAGIAATPSLEVVRRIGDSLVLAFTPGPDTRPSARGSHDLAPLPRGSWKASSSLGPDSVARALDGSRDTAWSTGERLEALDSPFTGLRLLAQMGSWRDFLALVPRGPAWFAVDLGTPHAVRRVTIEFWELGGEARGAPVIEASVDGTTWFPLSADAVVRPSIAAIDRRRPPVRIDYDFAPTTLRYLRLQQRGYWSLHDLQVFT